MNDDIEFTRLEPTHISTSFDINQPTMVAADLEWEDLVSLLTLSYYFSHQELDYCDLAARYVVTTESVEDLIKAELPAVSWWRSLLSRAREAQVEGEHDEVEDWQTIGGNAMGYYALHLSLGDYPLSIPEMRRFYIQTASNQCRCKMLGIPAHTEAVSDDDLDLFMRRTAEFDVAMARRLRAISAISDDIAINSPLFGAPTDLDMEDA